MHVAFFFNDTATTEIYTLSLHDALPICHGVTVVAGLQVAFADAAEQEDVIVHAQAEQHGEQEQRQPGLDRVDLLEDRKSTRLNSSHANISSAVSCLKNTPMTP